MTRQEEIRNAIDKIIPISPSRKGRTYEQSLMATGFESGVKGADANPKSPWISVNDDLPCNHEEMVVSSGIEEKDTLIVLVRFAVGFVDFAYMYYSNNEWRWNMYFKVSHWMLVPEFKED